MRVSVRPSISTVVWTKPPGFAAPFVLRGIDASGFRASGFRASGFHASRELAVRDGTNGGENLRVSAAAAQVAAHARSNLVVRRAGISCEQRVRGHELAGRAEAALRGVLRDERPLER